MKYFIILNFWIIAIEAFSQESKKIDFSVSLGANYSIPYKKSFSDRFKSEYTNLTSSFGFHIDIMIGYKIDNHLTLSSGPSLYQSRFDVERFKMGSNTAASDTGFNRITCLSFPILLKCKISEKIPICFGIGPYMGIIIRAKDKGVRHITSPTSPEYVFNYAYDITDLYTILDIGATLLLDYDMILRKGFSVFLFSKFNYGFNNVKKLEDWILKIDERIPWKNYNLFLGVGVKL